MHSYDAAGRLDTITSGDFTAQYAYVPLSMGLVQSVTRQWGSGPAVITTNTYQPGRDSLANVAHTVGGTPTSAHEYVTNALNQRTSRADIGAPLAGAEQTHFGYNARGEVTSAQRFGGSDIRPSLQNNTYSHNS